MVEEWKERPLMRAGAMFGLEAKTGGTLWVEGSRHKCATFSPGRQKGWFITGLTSQIWCIEVLACQERHI